MREERVQIAAGEVTLEGNLVVPTQARGAVLFAHGSGSGRHSPRNRFVAAELQRAGLATLLMDLLTVEEESMDRFTAHLRFNIPMLARRLIGAIDWLGRDDRSARLDIGLFGASTGAAAALMAAAERPDAVRAVVSRGGRPDLAGDALPRVKAPTLLIVGGHDHVVIDLNEAALERMRAEKLLQIVPGASHLFPEPGALEQVARAAAEWFTRHLDHDAASRSTNPGPGHAGARIAPRGNGQPDVAALVSAGAEPFGEIDEADLRPLLDRVGDARVVLIGEATHGTSEFYRMRQAITRALIGQRGFTIVAAEADWPDAEHVDEYVRARAAKPERARQAFSRFPSWMWRNLEVLEFVEWLRAHNEAQPAPARVGFYGLDIYSLYSSIEQVLGYLEGIDLELADVARRRYGCLMPFKADPALYGRAVITRRYHDCEGEAVAMLNDLLARRLSYVPADGERFFDAAQNARVIAGAEQYYRVMYYGAPESWNLRDRHMFDTLRSLLDFRGPDARAVVWAHNSHVGNAAATELSAMGELNIGQLAREAFGEEAYLIGFGTHEGTVAAASSWGGLMELMQVRPSHPGSYERVCHDSGMARFLLPLRAPRGLELRHALGKQRLERAIGVIYRPDTELPSHYFRAALPEQFDEYIWFDHSEAVRALGPMRAPALPGHHPFLFAD